jgi:hypothetical protein
MGGELGGDASGFKDTDADVSPRDLLRRASVKPFTPNLVRL